MYTNTVGRSAYRGPWQFESLAREVLLDIAARQMGMDPIELRRRNLLRQDELPYTNPNGMPLRQHLARSETFEQALAMLDYEAFRARAGRRPARRGGTSVSACRPTWSPPLRVRLLTRPRRRPSASSPPARSTSTSPVGPPATASRRRWSSSPPTPSGVDIDDVATIQGDTALTGFGAGAGGQPQRAP